MATYWMHAAIDVMAAGHTKTQSSGIPYLTVFGIIGTFIGVVAATQQLISAFRRRKYASAEEKLLRAIEASDAINSSLTQVEQYQRLKDSLRSEIENQIPKRARNAYLTNRLGQLTDELDRTYREYEDVRRELGDNQSITELDRRVQDAIEASMPVRRIQESRNLYMLALIALLIIFNISPLGLNNYFNILGYSASYTVAALVLTMCLGVLCVTLAFLVILSFAPRMGRRLRTWYRSLLVGSKVGVVSLSILFLVLVLFLGFFARSKAISQNNFNGNNEAWLTCAGTAFNVTVVILSVFFALLIVAKQQKIALAKLNI